MTKTTSVPVRQDPRTEARETGLPPWSRLGSLRDEIDRLLGGFDAPWLDRPFAMLGAQGTLTPAMDLTENGLIVRKPGKFTKMVEAVEHVTFSGRRAVERGQKVLYVTERCVIQLTRDGLIATEIMPGIEAERDIVQASQGRVKVAENATVMPKALLSTAAMGLAL